jgi:hypothetical protein
MRIQKRDEEIFKAIFENEGVLAKRQIHSMFWFGKSWRAMEQRLSKLFNGGYIDWPSTKQRKEHPIPEPVCWLGPKGIAHISGEHGVYVERPKNEGEYQLREYQRNLRSNGIRWVRFPRWSLLRHDIAVVDYRIALEESVKELSLISIERWLPESAFRSDMDVVAYTIKDRAGKVKHSKKGVCPDAYCEIIDKERELRGERHRARLLLELDMATHDNLRFGREKIAPGVAYIKSPAYKARFDKNSGIWLVVTFGGNRRLHNLMRQAEKFAGQNSGLFLFSTLDKISEGNILTTPIWQKVGESQSRSILG